MLNRRVFVAALLVLALIVPAAPAQIFDNQGTTGTGTTGLGTTGTGTTGLGNLQQLLNQAGLGGLGTTGLQGTTGTGTTTGQFPGGFAGTGTGTTGSLGGIGQLGGGQGGLGGIGTGEFLPSAAVVGNQFGATSAAALQARSPGLQLRRAIGVSTGRIDPFTQTEPVSDPSFFRLAFEELVFTILDAINQGISTLGSSFGLGNFGTTGLGGLTSLFGNPSQTPNQQTNITPIDNAATNGQGTTTQIP